MHAVVHNRVQLAATSKLRSTRDLRATRNRDKRHTRKIAGSRRPGNSLLAGISFREYAKKIQAMFSRF
jgi:hypothetical protein